MNGITAFEAMSNVGAGLILESAEKLGLLGCPAVAIHKKEKGTGAFSRFINSGWGVAAVCAFVAVGVMGGIIWAGNQGRQPGYLPPTETTEESETVFPQESQGATHESTSETTPPATEPSDPFADLVNTWFTGVLISSSSYKGYTAEVEVCIPYADVLGETVTLLAETNFFYRMRPGDEISVLVSSVTDGDPKTVHITDANVIAPGPNNPYYRKIPPIEDFIMEQKLVDYFNSSDRPELRESNNDLYRSLYRVIKIDKEQNVCYLAQLFSTVARYAVTGIPDMPMSEGDHISLNTSKHYEYSGSGFHSYVVYAEDITELRVLEPWEYVQEYFYYEEVDEKPVLYLYPQVPTEVSVRLVTNGKLTCTYPAYGRDGWQKVMAHPDGTLYMDGREYYCLYWEAAADMKPDLTRGACVKGEDSAAYLEYALAALGLNQREANEFIIYWLPRLEQNPYNLITFQTEAYTSVVGLEITPAPDSLLRICMVAQPLNAPVEIEEQTFEPFVREGFVAVEWGGVMLP